MRDLMEGRHGVFFWRNLGNGPLHFYWVAFLVKGLGLPLNYLTLKTATAVCGLLVAPALFLLGRELGGLWLGVAAAGFGAWSKWSVALARQGVEYIYPIPLTALVLWAVLRYQRRGDRGSVLAAGAAIGVGLSTYLSFRIVPLLVPLAFGVALFDPRRKGRRWTVVRDGVLAAATSAMLFLPVIKFAFLGEHREFFWSRIATRATAAERALAGNPWRVFAGNLWNMAKAFHWRGSSTWTVLHADEPFLDIVSGGLFLAGLVLLVRLAMQKSWRWATLVPAFFLLTLPTTLSIAFPDENPSLNRAGPVLPVVFVLVGLAFAHVWTGFLRERVLLRVAGLSAMLAGAGWSVQMNAEAYFVRLGESYDALIEHALPIADVIGRYRAQGIPIRQSYLLAVDFWVDARIIALELGDPSWSDTNNIAPPKIPAEPDRAAARLRLPGERPGACARARTALSRRDDADHPAVAARPRLRRLRRALRQERRVLGVEKAQLPPRGARVHPDVKAFGLEEGDDLLVGVRRDVVVVLEGDAGDPAERGVGKAEDGLELRALAVDLEEVAAGNVEPVEGGDEGRRPDVDRSGGALAAVARRPVLARESGDRIQDERSVGRGDRLRKRAGVADAVDAQVLFQAREGLGEGLERVDPALRTEAPRMHGEVAHPGADVHDGPVRLDPGAPLVVAVETGLLQDPDFHPGRDAEAGAAVEGDDERQRDRQAEEEPQDPADRPHPEQDRRDGRQVVDPARRAPAARAPRRRHGFFAAAAATCTVPTALAAVSTT